MDSRLWQMHQFVRLIGGMALLLGHDSVAVSVCWTGRSGWESALSGVERLWLGVPLLAIGALFTFGALFDLLRAKQGFERFLAGVALAWVGLGGAWFFIPPPIWSISGYDRLAAHFSSTNFGGMPLGAFAYTLLFAGTTRYVLRPPQPRAADAASASRAALRAYCCCGTAFFVVGFAGILHLASGTFGR